MYQAFKKKFRSLTHSSQLINSLYSQLNIVKTQALSFIDDETFAQIKYWEATGKNLNLENPVTFNEKLWWLKFNYRHPLMTQCSDKVKVRDYIESIGLGGILTNIAGVYSKVEDIPFNQLEGKFFIKCNHVSGTNAIYDSKHPELFDFSKFKNEFNTALGDNYYYQSREWNYKNIKPKIIVEYFIETQDTLFDYKVFCFHGEAKLILVDKDVALQNGKHNPKAKRNIYSRGFILKDFTIGRENHDDKLITKPINLSEMLKIAEIISKPFPFCRVDLYNNNGEIRFGEITFYPGGGTQQFSSEQADLMVSSWLDIS